MTTCTKCGAEIDDMAEVCHGCMAEPPFSPPAGSARVRYHCTSCQTTTNDPDVCEHCGEYRAGVIPDVPSSLPNNQVERPAPVSRAPKMKGPTE